jgi:programmed cell death 6-interacting protein
LREKGGNQSSELRDEMMKNLAAASNIYNELHDNLQEGIKFYNELTPILLKFQTKVNDFVFARKTEKEDLMRDIQSSLSRPGSGSATAAAMQKPNRPAPPAPPASNDYQQQTPAYNQNQFSAPPQAGGQQQPPYPASPYYPMMPMYPYAYYPPQPGQPGQQQQQQQQQPPQYPYPTQYSQYPPAPK